jgi:uncharacterized membrane protein
MNYILLAVGVIAILASFAAVVRWEDTRAPIWLFVMGFGVVAGILLIWANLPH